MDVYRWNKDPSLKNFYEAEIGVLKRGLSGNFKLLDKIGIKEQDDRIIAVGNLKFEGDKEQAIQIVFPTKYPSTPPLIIPINLQVDNNGNVVNSTVHHFGKGNQYNNGSMCLLRREVWDKNEHNIGWTLRKSQKWLRYANSQDGFPPHEIVEEVLPLTKPEGQVLLPKDFVLPKGVKTGQILLKQFKPKYFILEHNILPNSPFSIQIGVTLFDWYSFDEGILLRDIIALNNPQKMVNVLNNLFGKNPYDGNSNFAFHIPDESNPWHFFNVSPNGQLKYYIARNIDKELYLRTKDIFDESILKTKKVTIIGLGSLGSEVARSLARNAVGHFNLFDSDTFEIGNSVRHAADLFFIGESKVDVAKQLILRSNPNITINAYGVDVLNDNGKLEESLSDSDLCIVLTGEDSVDYLINDIYVPHFEIPFIFAGVSAGGYSGSVQIVKYKKTPCLRCLSKKGADVLPQPKKKVKFKELSPEFGSCSSPALPGSEIDTKEIALQVSRVALQELLSSKKSIYPSSKGNQYYWHGPMGSTKKDPFTWEIKNLKKYKECNICGSPK